MIDHSQLSEFERRIADLTQEIEALKTSLQHVAQDVVSQDERERSLTTLRANMALEKN